MHASTAEINPECPPPPSQEDSPTGSPAPNGSRRFARLVLIATVVLALGIGAFLFAPLRNKIPQANETSSSSSANFSTSGSLRLKGTTEAVRMRAILAPVLAGQFVATLTVTKLIASGTNVKRGDLRAEFDRQSQIRDSFDKQAEYDKLVSQVVGEQAKENVTRAKDETEIKEAEGALSKAQLEMQKVEILSRIDAEKAQQDLEEAQAKLAQLRETFALKRKAGQAAIRILEIQRNRTEQIMLHARADAELLQIRAPLDGVVVLNTIWKQGKIGAVQEGDQLRPGTPFMQVVDPSLMQVRVFANQEDLLSLRTGQSARIHLDAYPELVFPGRLEEMAPMGRSGEFSARLRPFTVVFSITGKDPKLMPDLSAAVDVELAERNRAAGWPR